MRLFARPGPGYQVLATGDVVFLEHLEPDDDLSIHDRDQSDGRSESSHQSAQRDYTGNEQLFTGVILLRHNRDSIFLTAPWSPTASILQAIENSLLPNISADAAATVGWPLVQPRGIRGPTGKHLLLAFLREPSLQPRPGWSCLIGLDLRDRGSREAEPSAIRW